MADPVTNKVLFDAISAYLGSMDLGGLFTVGPDGKPAGWLWEQISTGIDSEAALMIQLEQTQEFKNRYGIIHELRALAREGQPVYVPSVGQVREYEQRALQMMTLAGMPDWMRDSWRDAHDLMRKNISLVELEQRVGSAWSRVYDTPPEVRDAYARFYGIEGDAALAATFLDPERTLANLELNSRAAYTAGMGKLTGLDLDRQLAERIASTPKTDAGIYEDLTRVGELNAQGGVFTETISEVNDLTAEREGIGAISLGDGEAAAQLERRQIERSAQRAAVPGGALLTNRGLSGVG